MFEPFEQAEDTQLHTLSADDRQRLPLLSEVRELLGGAETLTVRYRAEGYWARRAG